MSTNLVVTSASHFPTEINPRSKEGSHIQCMPHLGAFWRFPLRKTPCVGFTPYVPAYVSPKSCLSIPNPSDQTYLRVQIKPEWKWERESSLILLSELLPAGRRPALAKI